MLDKHEMNFKMDVEEGTGSMRLDFKMLCISTCS